MSSCVHKIASASKDLKTPRVSICGQVHLAHFGHKVISTASRFVLESKEELHLPDNPEQRPSWGLSSCKKNYTKDQASQNTFSFQEEGF